MKLERLSDRMKGYEKLQRKTIPKRSYTILRLDGKAFHTYTKGLRRPYDYDLLEDMAETAKFLCENIQGAYMAYTQSDEISILLTPFAKEQSETWFDAQIQKMVSVSASFATAKFNELRKKRFDDYRDSMASEAMEPLDKRYDPEFSKFKLAFFDSRVFTVPTKLEAMNYFIWRQRDAIKNSVSMQAQALYSHKELHKKNTDDKLKMILDKGVDWNQHDDNIKQGTIVEKHRETCKNEHDYPNQPEFFTRTFWKHSGAPKFVVDDDLDLKIPSPGYGYVKP